MLNKSPEERVQIRKSLFLKLSIIVILVVLWRVYVTLNEGVTLWESIVSGIALMLIGWYCTVTTLQLRKTITGLLNKIYLWIGTSTACINIFVLLYYIERWGVIFMGASNVVPLENIWRSLRFILYTLFYCSIFWLTNYLKEMSDDYGFPASK
jgi:hypothetical protein